MSDIFEDLDYAYIEFYVGMAKMVTYWHVKALGFELVAYKGPETGCPDTVSFLIQKNNVRFVITSAASPSNFDVLSFVDRHGNGVKKIAYAVNNVKQAYETAVQRGGIPVGEIRREEDDAGCVEEAAIRLLGRKEIAFVDTTKYHGLFRPGFEPLSIPGFAPDFDNGFQFIDHIAYGLHVNEMDFWSRYFQNIFGGEVVQDLKPGDVITEYSGLLLRLLRSPNRKLMNVFVEPENRSRPSQVQEYLEAYYGSGIQHMAFATDNIFQTVVHMRRTGVEFVKYPPAYYTMMREAGKVPADLIDKLQDHNVLCDASDDGAFLFQTFTKPFGDRPTFFYEVIQRTAGYEGFALQNITQLFKAVEREQELRIKAKENT